MPRKKKQGDTSVATLENKPDEVVVEELPKGQTRAEDGTLILSPGRHDELTKATYLVHDARVILEGNVFVAKNDVNWLPAVKCVCKAARPSPLEVRKLSSGKTATLGECNNKDCDYRDTTYLWVHPEGRFIL